MARRKTHPDYVRVKSTLSQRLKQVRTMLHGERGGPEMARRLNLPIRTWYNYESGVTVPAEVVLKFVELTGVDPMWLLRGQGEPFTSQEAEREAKSALPAEDPVSSISGLLREALHRLESRAGASAMSARSIARDSAGQVGAVAIAPVTAEVGAAEDRPRFVVAQRDWVNADVPFRCMLVEGDAMTPIVADGAFVAFSEQVEPLESLNGQMVVARTQGRTVVRWLQISGGFAILRAENREVEPSPILVETDGDPGAHPFRRVLWISTPH